MRTTLHSFVHEITAFIISEEIEREKENHVSSTKKRNNKHKTKIINHDMNLQTTLIINTLSKVTFTFVYCVLLNIDM